MPALCETCSSYQSRRAACGPDAHRGWVEFGEPLSPDRGATVGSRWPSRWTSNSERSVAAVGCRPTAWGQTAPRWDVLHARTVSWRRRRAADALVASRAKSTTSTARRPYPFLRQKTAPAHVRALVHACSLSLSFPHCFSPSLPLPRERSPSVSVLRSAQWAEGLVAGGVAARGGGRPRDLAGDSWDDPRLLRQVRRIRLEHEALQGTSPPASRQLPMLAALTPARYALCLTPPPGLAIAPRPRSQGATTLLTLAADVPCQEPT